MSYDRTHYRNRRGRNRHTVSAVMTMRGFEVTLYDDERFARQLAAVRELGGIQLRGRLRGCAAPARVTSDTASAIRGAQAIFVHVPPTATRRSPAASPPYLEEGQHILIIPGNLGSFIFRRVFQEMSVTAKVTLTEKDGNFCPCRLSAPAEVTVGLPLSLKGQVYSLPASDTEFVLRELEGVVGTPRAKTCLKGRSTPETSSITWPAPFSPRRRSTTKGNQYSLFKYAFTPLRSPLHRQDRRRAQGGH